MGGRSVGARVAAPVTRWLPTLPQISAETIAVVLGAIAGAIIIQNLPSLKAWLQANYATPMLAAGPTSVPDSVEAQLRGSGFR